MKKGPFTSGEMFLVGWRETHNGGFVASFLVDQDLEDRIRGGTVGKGKTAGQRYAVALTELGADEKPITPKEETLPAIEKAYMMPDGGLVPAPADAITGHRMPHKPHFPGGLCGLAVRWCDDDHFIAWVIDTFDDVLQTVPGNGTNDLAKYIVCQVCSIKSRKELDTNPEAAAIFRTKILEPYSAVRKEDGVDED